MSHNSAKKGNVALIGARGAGKSKISRKLAKMTGRAPMSTDTLVSYEASGRSIARIVAEEGWVGFRNREYEILGKLIGMSDLVIDCGGGIIVEAPEPGVADAGETLSRRKCDLLREGASVVYVKRDLAWLLDKSGVDPNRPDLGGEYEALLNRRLPWYEQIADYTLDMALYSVPEAVALIIGRYGLEPGAESD